MNEIVERALQAMLETRKLYYVGTVHNGNMNAPVGVYRFSDHEEVCPLGHYEDAMKWIDERCIRAAIAAMREPTEAMYHAANEAIFQCGPSLPNIVWPAMIDEILSDSPP